MFPHGKVMIEQYGNPARCPFCRSYEEDRKRLQKRMNANVPHVYAVSVEEVIRTGVLVKTMELQI